MPRDPVLADLRITFDTEYVAWTAVQGLEDADDLPDELLLRNELLDYTGVVGNLRTGEARPFRIRLEDGKGGRKYRKKLGTVIGLILQEAVRTGLIPVSALKTRAPSAKSGPRIDVELWAHFTRADMCSFADWPELKRRFDGVRGTLVTTTTPKRIAARLPNGRQAAVSVHLRDSMLLAPAKFGKLEKIGEAMGLDKGDVPERYKSRMDLYRRDCPEDYDFYSVRDAEIVDMYADMISTFLREEIGLTGRVPATLGSAGVRAFVAHAEAEGVNLNDFLGGETKNERFTARDEIVDHATLLADSYHGARNEPFLIGPSPEPHDWYDIDESGAYGLVMAMLRVPDWERLRQTRDLEALAVVDSGISVARIRFGFPPGTRFPSLPVRTRDGARGLIYPLAGTTTCTGPELVVARNLGCDIEVLNGLVIPFRDDDVYPIASFTAQISEIRAKYPKKSIQEQAAKEMLNSLYGKLAQGIEQYKSTGKVRRVFDPRTGQSERLPPSRITSLVLANYITGFVRALGSELLAAMPDSAMVGSITTDGWLTTLPLEQHNLTGPIAHAFLRASQRVRGTDEILEVKHGCRAGIVPKTRGLFATEPLAGHKAPLARAGQRIADEPRDALNAGRVWAEVYRSRTYDTTVHQRQLISLRDQHKSDADLVGRTVQKRLNLEPDFKRRPVRMHDVGGMLAADTVAWQTVDEFECFRDDFEEWRHQHRACCVTTADYERFLQWRAGRPDRASVDTRRTPRPPLVQLTMRAWAHGSYGMPGASHKVLADVAARWWPTSAEDVRNARRAKTLARVATVTPEEAGFAVALARAWPGIDWLRLVAPGSPAAQMLFDGVWDWWLRHGFFRPEEVVAHAPPAEAAELLSAVQPVIHPPGGMYMLNGPLPAISDGVERSQDFSKDSDLGAGLAGTETTVGDFQIATVSTVATN